MSYPVLVSVAWPYANAEIHVGNLTGAYLPADIVARYNRLMGRPVIMVSGSDSHGTPITVRADAENTSPVEVYQRYHRSFLELFMKMGLTYDLFTSTHTSNHFNISQKIFLALYQNGYIYPAREMQWFAPSQGRFLPDRYVEGTCYICGFTNARSDQCDKCGSLLDPQKLIEPHSRIDGSRPELRETEHYYLDLGKLQDQVVTFLGTRESYWRPNVVRQSLGQILADGLHGRPITRDLDWGIPVPLEGWNGKCLYVWFEAVIGYLSASIEWSQLKGQPDAWRTWWHNPEARSYYFIGKDNIPFHAVIWPAQLIGCSTRFDELIGSTPAEPLGLPYDVPANEFMNLEGEKISGSRNWAVWGMDALSRYDPDPLRYYLTVNMPEAKDTDWSWEDFYKRNNDELLATWGNLVNRVLAFAYKHWDGRVPEPGELSVADHDLLEEVESGFHIVGHEIEAVHLRSALAEAMRLATSVNRYLDAEAPWQRIKTDRPATARIVYTALRAIDSLKILLAPFLPFTSEKLNLFLGYSKPLFGDQGIENHQDDLGEHAALHYYPEKASGRWEPSQLEPGRLLQQPLPLIKKLDPSIIEEERQRLGKPH
jgi:methionyl-tRNA synthetase